MRMCAACRKMKPKDELIRLTAADGEIKIDRTGKVQARGVYICRNAECVRLAKKKKALERSFKRAVGENIYYEIENETLSRDMAQSR